MANRFTYQDQIFSVGDTINVHQTVKEADKTRTQVFTGVVIAIKGSDINKSITVRKIAIGSIGVERIFPLATPIIKKIDKEKSGKVRRAKLFYLRGRKGKQAVKIKDVEDKVKKALSKKKSKKLSTTKTKKSTKSRSARSANAKKTSRTTSRKPSKKASSK